MKCFCGKKAVKKVQVIWKGKEKYFPRCNDHIVKGYRGKVIVVTPEEIMRMDE